MIGGTAYEGGSVRDKIARFGDTSSAYRPPSGGVQVSNSGTGGGGSVRDKIAQFGDKSVSSKSVFTNNAPSSHPLKLSSARPATASSYSRSVPSSSAPSSYTSSTASRGSTSAASVESSTASNAPVRKLRVPDVFQNGSKPADAPVSSRVPASSSAPAKKWAPVGSGGGAATYGGGGGGYGSKPSVNPSGGVSGSSYSAESRGSTSSTSSSSSTGSSSAAIKRQTKRDRSVKSTDPPKRDLLGLNSVKMGGSRPAAVESVSYPTRSATGNRGKSGPGKMPVKAGPRKLQLKTLSAEKQRAALGLDRDADDL